MRNWKARSAALVAPFAGLFLLSACGDSDAPSGTAGGNAAAANVIATDFSGRQSTCDGEACERGKATFIGSEPTIAFAENPGFEGTGMAPEDMTVVETDEKCIDDGTGNLRCKPAAGSIALLPNNSFVYFNALEGTENVEASIVAEFGFVSINDQSRMLSFGGAGAEDDPMWQRAAPLRAGGNLDGNDSTTLLPTGFIDDSDSTAANDAALFCADLIQLADGRIMAAGGTDYFTEPSLSASENTLREAFPALEDAFLLTDLLGAIDSEIPLGPVGSIGVPNDLGIVELEGVRNARIFDGNTGTWEQTGDMNQGRWYPSMITLPDGDVFIASGVTKLLKPVYLGDLENPGPNTLTNLLQSGDNVRIAERYDLEAGTWSEFGNTVDVGGVEFNDAERPLPLYPRMHLLPNGQVFYNAGGQAFNPFGQSYNQGQWNFVAAFDPEAASDPNQPEAGKGSWTTLGYAGFPLSLNEIGLGSLTELLTVTNPDLAGSLTGLLQDLAGGVANTPQELMNLLDIADPTIIDRALGSGFRGSTFSLMMPLEPDANGEYRTAEFLTAGGVLGGIAANSPGLYVATPFSRIDTVETGVSGGDAENGMRYSSRVTGGFNRGRWFTSAVLLPDGSALAFNGADADEVVLPGLARPVQMIERFDPATEQWEDMTETLNPRTYHNTAILMPDGRVLIGGHSPINTGYLNSLDLSELPLPDEISFSPGDGRDPSFEIYEPPYMFRDRPEINGAPQDVGHGQRFTVGTLDADAVESVMLIRRTSTTHLIDGDQRAVKLPFSRNGGGSLRVDLPQNEAVVPPGHYMLFINARDADGTLVPSVSAPVQVRLPG